jgi:hypothetical protein
MDIRDTETMALLPENSLDALRREWERVQVGFVDEPRQAVEQADRLVNDLVDQLMNTFAREREHLEETWRKGDQASTEDLRVALQRYRSFFQRLLTV